jgi:hypothetical protein
LEAQQGLLPRSDGRMLAQVAALPAQASSREI